MMPRQPHGQNIQFCRKKFVIWFYNRFYGGWRIVVNRKLLTGVSGLAGHVGHILSGVTDTECGCGRRGCVEAVSSGRAIMGAAKINLQDIAPNIFLN